MPPGRILRIPFLRPFFPRAAAILPFTRPASTSTRVLYHPVPTAPFPATSPFRNTRRSYSNSPPPSSNASNASSSSRPSSPEPTTFSGRLKVLIKSYGWYALGAYLFFSAVDFGFVFATVSFFGAEKVNQATAALRGLISDILHRPSSDQPPAIPGEGDAPEKNGSESLWAMIVLSYVIHKTLLLPVRVGLTAAFTPRLVRWLTSRGWTGAAGTRRAAEHMRNKIRNRTGRDSD